MRGPGPLKKLFFLLAVVLLAGLAATYWMGRAALQMNANVLRCRRTIAALQDFVSTLKDAETGQRGFLITGDPTYLQPHTEAIEKIKTSISELHTEASSGVLKESDVAKLQDLTAQKLAELETTIELKRTHRDAEMMDRVRSGRGKVLMDAIRERLAEMTATEEQRLLEAYSESRRYTILRNIVFTVTTLVELGFLLWVYRRILNERSQREAALVETRKQKELLRVTLTSIGDAVIVTDPEGRVTFLNTVAEQLTGWRLTEAQGQPCTLVFDIINEESRLHVESPVAKVLATGAVVGLANHTLLRRRDGSEIPIDDSGAPIRSETGAIQGVILVFRDFSQQRNAAKSMQQAKEEAEAANVAKDNFLATLSHELRTPLTPIIAQLTAWETNRDLPAALVPDVQMLRRNAELEARLIDDLLDLTRIARGKLVLNKELADMHELIGSVENMCRSELNAKKLRLDLALTADRHFVDADPARLQQVLWNLLRNAIKFTPEGGHIRINSSTTGNHMQVTVRDDGIGIRPDLIERLFSPFEQGDKELVRHYGGLGLGLAIVKALVSAHGGDIVAQSDGPGRGSTFTLSLPLAERGVDQQSTRNSTPSEPEEQPALRILLVEDHRDTAEVLIRLLNGLGHNTTAVRTVRDAEQTIRSERFDLLICDIGLPDGTGLDLIRKVRIDSDIPAIALTGFGMQQDIDEYHAGGFDEHLTKPVNFQKLRSVIDTLGRRERASG